MNVGNLVFLKSVEINVGGRTISEDVRLNADENELAEYAYGRLLEAAEGKPWHLPIDYVDRYAVRGTYRTYEFHNPEGEQATVTILFVPRS